MTALHSVKCPVCSFKWGIGAHEEDDLRYLLVCPRCDERFEWSVKSAKSWPSLHPREREYHPAASHVDSTAFRARMEDYAAWVSAAGRT